MLVRFSTRIGLIYVIVFLTRLREKVNQLLVFIEVLALPEVRIGVADLGVPLGVPLTKVVVGGQTVGTRHTHSCRANCLSLLTFIQ